LLAIVFIFAGLLYLIIVYAYLYPRLWHRRLTVDILRAQAPLLAGQFNSAYDHGDRERVRSLLVQIAIGKLSEQTEQSCAAGIEQLAHLGGKEAFDALADEMRRRRRPLVLRTKMAEAAWIIASKLQEGE
jgi:hypothetical protein